MKPHFQDLDLRCWEHGRRLGLTKTCLCVQGGPEVAGIVLQAIAELAADGPPAKRTISLRPTRRAKRVVKLSLLLSPEGDDLRQMSFSRNGDTATLEFTPKGLDAFREAVDCWKNGGEDFSLQPTGSRRPKKGEMGPRDFASLELWFWTPNMEP